jgi:cysteine desulfurase
MLYFDHAASSPLRECVLKNAEALLRTDFANPQAAHKAGSVLLKKIETARAFLLESVEARNGYDFIYTSSATEANNTILCGLGIVAGEEVFVSRADHPSVVVPVQEALKADLNEIPLTSKGQVDSDKLVQRLGSKTKLVILSWVNNHSGALNDVAGIAARIKKDFSRVHIHVDGVQAFSKFPLSLQSGEIDSLTVSAHKMGGPKGVSGFFLSKKVSLRPLLWGGGQENNLRSSTENSPLILLWDLALREAFESRQKEFMRASDLSRQLREKLIDAIPAAIFPFGEMPAQVSPWIFTFLLPRISSDVILRHLETKQIFISSSSACSSRVKGENPVFTALNIPRDLHKNVLRVSMGHNSNVDEIDLFVKELARTYSTLVSYIP